MKIYLPQNVFDATVERIEWLFDEFGVIIVNMSGGKDSTVAYHMTMQVAERRGRLPLKVMFVDQEAEWQHNIDYIRTIMHDERVEPIWLQCPIKLFNATSSQDDWLLCWDPDAEWIRPKEPDSIHENTFGTDRFTEMFEAYNRVYYPDEPVAHIGGVRAEESPARMMGLLTYATYKWVTWGRKEDPRRGHFTFYPLYDWTFNDVWKAIHDNGWPYCKIYDYMYQHGVPLRQMRITNFHHETAMRELFYLQEVEQDTWDAITRRLSGLNTVSKMQWDYYKPKQLPWMFDSWLEYRDHLLKNLITDPDIRRKMAKSMAADFRNFSPEIHDKVIQMHISMILANDYHGTKQATFTAAHGKWLVGGRYAGKGK